MKILLAIPQWESFAQLMTVLIIFLIVLAMTYLTTRWIANYQKEYNINHNIEVIETFKLTTNKYIQIVKEGDKYLVIGICKDSITMLSELPRDQVKLPVSSQGQLDNFHSILEKTKKMIKKK